MQITKARLRFATYLSLSTGIFTSSANAGVIFSDDFEAYTDVATTWQEPANDRDPTTPTVGDPWTIVESSPDRVQVFRSPVAGSGAFDTIFGTQYLHQQRGASGSSSAQANISVSGQSTIAANGNLILNVNAFNAVGSGFGGNLGLIAFDGPSFSNRAFDIAFRPDGSIRYYDGSSKSTGLTYSTNTWTDITINADFSTNTFDLTVDGSTVSGLGWEASGLTTIGLVDLEAFDQGGTSGRGGWDNLSISSVPEPSSATIVVIGCAIWCAAHRIRRRTIA